MKVWNMHLCVLLLQVVQHSHIFDLEEAEKDIFDFDNVSEYYNAIERQKYLAIIIHSLHACSHSTGFSVKDQVDMLPHA